MISHLQNAAVTQKFPPKITKDGVNSATSWWADLMYSLISWLTLCRRSTRNLSQWEGKQLRLTLLYILKPITATRSSSSGMMVPQSPVLDFHHLLHRTCVYKGALTRRTYMKQLQTTVFDFFGDFPLDQLRSMGFQHKNISEHQRASWVKLLVDKLKCRISGYTDNVRWLLKSLDITQLDFFL